MKLFEATETSFNDNGLGNLKPLKCLEYKKKSLNGWYIECEFSIKYKELIKQDMIIYVNTKEKGGQPFRCNNPTYTDKCISITANHVVFDSERYLLDDVEPIDLSPVSFLKWINNKTDISSPFLVTSNVSGSSSYHFIRKSLLDGFMIAEEIFGGSYDADKFSVDLKAIVGNDDGFSISYGKNLQSVNIVEDWSEVCTKVLPVGPEELQLPETYLMSNVQYEQPYTKVVEFDIDTSYENELGETIDYTKDELIDILRKETLQYLETSFVPKINYVVKSDVPQELKVGDIVHVKHPILTIDTEVRSYTYDIIRERVLSLEFGNYNRDVKKLFNSLKENIENAKLIASGALLESKKQTELINNINKEGHVYIDEYEILILDKLPKENAELVWRFGLGGIAFSENGYEGPFEYAFTQDGHFNIDFIQANSITTNKLSADIGSSLDISSNESVSILVGDVEKLELTADGLTNKLSSTGGNNLIKDSMGVFGDGWQGTVLIDKSIDVKKRNIYGFAILLSNEDLYQTITVPNGNYTLSFSYRKWKELANVSVIVNGKELLLERSDFVNLPDYTFTVDSGTIDITFKSDSEFSCTIANLMLNQGTQPMVWSLNANETWTDTVKMSSSGITIESSGTEVLFSAKADTIGFKNKNTGEYVAIFTDNGLVANELEVKNKVKFIDLLLQEINGQVVLSKLGSEK